ncbi:ABC transporter ATP-binding protein [Halarchaeum sp. CBA1220]|uniref:ABC transporter ATP-binding protein n=1 Tax=Halarchaeum sp. CBA1220 TaxID=1853682 RepID=UPI000F3AA12B|nr:ABC transporter ATP-binding protein [Halarchaeum sp. CBA1220]QLC34018.1 ABC transporter ATP-binding protein [Halarchaeum sp. CBA1220]
MPVIETRGLTKTYESGPETVEALVDVDFAVEEGEFVSIVGPSGSGKTTLLNMLGLLDQPTSGDLYVAGEDATALEERERTRTRKRFIGFVFQQFFLIPTLTAQENVEVPRLLERDPHAAERAADLLTQFGLGERLDHTPDELSGGQKQRVAIARSLINDPRLVLADEPTGNLDRTTSTKILEEFQRICGEGVAVIAVTHDELLEEYVDRTVEIVDGELTR